MVTLYPSESPPVWGGQSVKGLDMAGSPVIKVYTAAGEYEGSVKHWESAAALVSMLGEGATIRHTHKTVVWTEGKDGNAGESYDGCAAHCERRKSELVPAFSFKLQA